MSTASLEEGGGLPRCVLRSNRFSPKEVIHHGQMMKRGDINTQYKRRYFVLTASHLLYFHNQFHKARFCGQIDLDDIYNVESFFREEENEHFVIMLFTTDRIWVLSTVDLATQNTWMMHFGRLIEGPEEPESGPALLSLTSLLNTMETSPSIEVDLGTPSSKRRSKTPPGRRHTDNLVLLNRQKHTHRRLMSCPPTPPTGHNFFVTDEKEEVTVKLSYPSEIPKMLVILKDLLCKTGGLEQDGIFRIEPPQTQRDHTITQFEEGTFHNCDNPHIVASLIKMYLRNRPTYVLDDMDIRSLSGQEDKVNDVLDQIGEPRRSLFLCVVDICVLVASRSDVNQMTHRNLAIVFAPNLWQPSNEEWMLIEMLTNKVIDFMTAALEWRSKQSE